MSATPAARAARRPVAALLFNAMIWGLTWWPMRALQARGMHPLWATAVIFALAVVAIGLWKPHAWRELATHPALWLILLAAGTTNACFNWGITAGDVVRVVLLFYLMPLWTVVLARLVLHEPVTRAALLRVALALAGAVLVLWPAEGQHLNRVQPIDLLGLLGGFSFACNNILLKRESARSEGGRGLAMFLGGALVSLVLTQVLAVSALPPLSAGWLPGVLGLALVYLASNLALQYGASRLPANVTAVIMLTEVLWAAGSALALGAGTLTLQLAMGGALIVAGAALAALRP
ncbi:MAG TPA: DMT family transporter [Ideonella sp.]|uniref:DMT family transporter n=1 Tax=Ideonella sp. TaxID=1929293 RepID=UPI002CD2657E|nr:DMT family transporter [Ideonella sp.]HSI47839.1 DMT family transporter [Ideonella sp.]